MHLISALAAGVTGAENGTASIYRRGTATPTTWYEDFEGAGPKTGDVTLDQHGGAEVYVNELVTVTVRDLDGGAVRTFTAGVDAPAVEVKSQSFTGTNYETAITGAGEPTTLQKVLDRWFDSSGAVDFQVLVNGNPTNISTFSDLVTENVFNVQDEAYGAVGDGTTDDTSSIQAAISAAQAAGGGTVFFPSGEYAVTSVTTAGSVPIELRGDGQDLSVLQVDMSAGGELTLSATGSRVSMRDMAVESSTADTASALIVVGPANAVDISSCTLGSNSASTSQGKVISIENARVIIDRCSINYTMDSSIPPNRQTLMSVIGSGCTVSECRMLGVGDGDVAAFVGLFGIDDNSVVQVSDCVIDASVAISGYSVFFGIGSSPLSSRVMVSGCDIVGSATASGTVFFAVINSFFQRIGSTYLGDNLVAVDPTSEFGSAEYRDASTSLSGGVTFTVDGSRYRFFVIDHDTAGDLNVTLEGNNFQGDLLALRIRNVSGGVSNISWSPNVIETENPAMANLEARMFLFVSGGSNWHQVGTSAVAV